MCSYFLCIPSSACFLGRALNISEYVVKHQQNLQTTIQKLGEIDEAWRAEEIKAKLALAAAAADNQTQTCSTIAMQIVRLQRQREGISQQKTHLSSMFGHLIHIESEQALYQSLRATTRYLLRVNRNGQHNHQMELLSECFSKEMGKMNQRNSRLRETMQDVEEDAGVESDDGDADTEALRIAEKAQEWAAKAVEFPEVNVPMASMQHPPLKP